jgi:hypothetical protein
VLCIDGLQHVKGTGGEKYSLSLVGSVRVARPEPREERISVLRIPRGSKISCGNLLFLDLLMKVSDSLDLEEEKNPSGPSISDRSLDLEEEKNPSGFFDVKYEHPVKRS